MASRDPFTGNWYDNEWDAFGYSLLKELVCWDQNWSLIHYFCFCLVLEYEISAKTTNSTLIDINSCFKQCCKKTRLIGNKENNSRRGHFPGLVKLNINLTKIRFQQLHCTLNENLVLCFHERNKTKTHKLLLKPFTFYILFASFGIYKGFPYLITPVYTLFDNSLLLTDLCPLVSVICFWRGVLVAVAPYSCTNLCILGRILCLKIFFATSWWDCHHFIPVDLRFEHAHLLALLAHFTKLFKSAIGGIATSQIAAIAVDQPLIPLTWTNSVDTRWNV